MSSHRDHSAVDPAIAPLAYPAVAVACALLAVAITALPQLPLWAEDYGTTLVYTALSLYSILALLLLRWGWRSRPRGAWAARTAIYLGHGHRGCGDGNRLRRARIVGGAIGS